MIYPKPFHYTLSHVIIGFLAAYYPWVGVIAIVYQLTQLVLNVRFFPAEWVVRQGNSVEHTFMKLSEIGLGYLIGLFLRRARHQT